MTSTIATLLGEGFMEAIRHVIREELRAAREEATLLTPDELAGKLKVPVSWIYEQSRQRNIPTHRLGRYIRFDLREVLASQAAKRLRKNSTSP